MKKIDLTLVCCYNNKKQLNEELINSLDKQNVSCDRVFIDNTHNRFSSAASALNYGASQVKTKYVVFLHQDVVFLNANSLEEIYKYIKGNDGSIIGVAGVKLDREGVYTSILHGPNKLPAGHYKIDRPEKVISIDECLFGMSLKIYNKLKFDEKNFDNWHLYAVDMCYNANLNGINTYVIPASIWHTSIGTLNHAFFVGIRRMKNKYKKDFKYIKSTCITLKCSEFVWYKELKVMKVSKTKLYKKLKDKK